MSTKLYTEEQVIDIITKAFLSEYPTISNDILNEFTPIELPSDEEIQKISQDIYGVDLVNIYGILEYKAFNRGAKWMRDKIQGGKQ